MRPVTIRDVALHAGVSTKTVSRVVNGEPHVRPEVRAEVQRVIDRLDYRPNANARSLSGSRSYLLAMFIDDPASGYAAGLQLGALMRCRERSYHLVIEPVALAAPDGLRQVETTLKGLRLDGAILAPPVCDDPALLDLFERSGTPFVRIAPGRKLERSGYVRMDDRAAARDMTRLLISQNHRVIAFIKGAPTHRASAYRFDGFIDALVEAGLTCRPEHIGRGDFSLRSGVQAGESVLAAPGLPTAVFASNDDMALGVLITAMKLGLKVPDDLAIAGFDDAPTARAAWPPITTVRQPNAEMAACAVDILIDGNYAASPQDEAYQRTLAYEIIERESTRSGRR